MLRFGRWRAGATEGFADFPLAAAATAGRLAGMALHPAAVDRLLAPEFVAGIGEAPIEELRSKRDECHRAETALSYVRRLLQGRLDIVHAEMERRAEGDPEAHPSDLIDRLPEILAGPSRSATPSHLPLTTLPGVAAGMSDSLDLELTSLGGVEELPSNLIALDDEALHRAADDLQAQEEQVSARRHAIHKRIDELQAQIVARHKAGSVDVGAILRRERES